MSVPVVLTIAGSDSGGGAGIQADLKTFAALGVYGTSAITAVTAQNTFMLGSVLNVPASSVCEQIDAVFSDFSVSAVKIGMLGTPEVAECVAERMCHYGVLKLVLDPVMRAGVHDSCVLTEDDARLVLIEKLFPRSFLVTPNIPEASMFLGISEKSVSEDPKRVCQEIFALGPKYVVLKGGHTKSDSVVDYFYDGDDFVSLELPRIKIDGAHGTGCTFASAIASFLARGDTPLEAVRRSKDFVYCAIENAEALAVGGGTKPVHHFVEWWGN